MDTRRGAGFPARKAEGGFLAAEGEVRERRDQLRHPMAAKPELVAHAPNQVWSWDITQVKTVEKWAFYALYVVLDIFSRFVVGWSLVLRENAAVARQLIEACCREQGITRQQLTLHADRGSAMTSKTGTDAHTAAQR